MPIAPGTPIPTGQVHPLATLMGGGIKNFAHGASLASARMDQNSAGLTAFFADSVRQQIAMRAKSLEERKFAVGTELKKDELDWRRSEGKADREQKEREMTASHGIAWSREQRLQEEHDAKMDRQKTMDNLMAELLGGSRTDKPTRPVEEQGTADWTQPVTQTGAPTVTPTNHQGYNMWDTYVEGDRMLPSATTYGQPAPTAQQQILNNPAENAPAPTADGTINQLEQAVAKGNPQRDLLQRGVSVGERELGEAYDRMRKLRMASIQLYVMQGNYSAAMGIRMQMESDDLERLEAQYGTTEEQAEVIKINNEIWQKFDRFSHVFKGSDLSPQHQDEAIKELIARNSAFAMTEMPEGSLRATLGRNERVSVDTLKTALNFQADKIASWELQKSNLGLVLGHTTMASKQLDARFDPMIKREEAKRTLFETALTREVGNLNLSEMSSKSLKLAFDAQQKVSDSIELTLAGIGGSPELATSKEDHPDYKAGKKIYVYKSGKLQQNERSLRWYNDQYTKDKDRPEKLKQHAARISTLITQKAALKTEQAGAMARLALSRKQEIGLSTAMNTRRALLNRTDGSVMAPKPPPTPIVKEEIPLNETREQTIARQVANAVTNVGLKSGQPINSDSPQHIDNPRELRGGNTGKKIFPGEYPTVRIAGKPENVKLSVVTAFKGSQFEKQHVIPTMWGGKVYSIEDAMRMAKKIGWEKFPSFKNEEEAAAWAAEQSGNVSRDGRLFE